MIKLVFSLLLFSSLSFGQVKFVSVATDNTISIFDSVVQLESVVTTTDRVYKIDFSLTTIEQGTVNIITTVTFPSSPSASLDCTIICNSQKDVAILGDACLCFQKVQPALFAWSLLSFPILP